MLSCDDEGDKWSSRADLRLLPRQNARMPPPTTKPPPPSGVAASSAATPAPTPFLSSVRSLLTPTPHSTVLTDLAPQLFHSRILASPHFNTRSKASSLGSSSNSLRARLGWPGQQPSSAALYIHEKVDELCRMDVPPALFDLSPASPHDPAGFRKSIDYMSANAQVPLIRGFMATTPAAQTARLDRRRRRAGLSELALGLDGTLGLKERGEQARGLLGGADVEDLGINRRTSGAGVKRRKAGVSSRASSGAGLATVGEDAVLQSPEELAKDAEAVEQDMANIAVRRVRLAERGLDEVEADPWLCAGAIEWTDRRGRWQDCCTGRRTGGLAQRAPGAAGGRIGVGGRAYVDMVDFPLLSSGD